LVRHRISFVFVMNISFVFPIKGYLDSEVQLLVVKTAILKEDQGSYYLSDLLFGFAECWQVPVRNVRMYLDTY
jgi:hypothetical protein